MFAPLYECRNCGDVWQNIEAVSIIDIDHDEYYEIIVCSKCGTEVTEKVDHNGFPIYHAMTKNEIIDEMMWGAIE